MHRTVNGHKVVSFCSNDYLGLASDPRIVKAFQRGAETYGVGTGASCLINGYTRAHAQLEERLSEFTGRDRALLFSTGYMANLGVICSLSRRNTVVLEDRLNHASLLDAAQLARAKLKRYPHCDTQALEQQLAATPNALVASDTLFSMEGDLAPLPQLAAICTKHHAALFVDDAHGFGVFGQRGAGTPEHYALSQQQVPALVATFGKACGTFGAFAAGSEEFIQTLVQTARPYIYTTAPPAAIACATLESLKIIENETSRREKLRYNIMLFKQLAAAAELPQTTSQTAIQPLIVNDTERALALSDALLKSGIQVAAIRPPTVPEGTARLRITLSSQHEENDVRMLVHTLAACQAGIAKKHPRSKHSKSDDQTSSTPRCPV